MRRIPPALTAQHAALLTRMAGRRILVVGDLILDEYVVGRAMRLSREAPVPVLELVERFWRPGAASNPAASVAALGGVPRLIGVLGTDPAGRTLAAELSRAGIGGPRPIETSTPPTATKKRNLPAHAAAHPQQGARGDYGPSQPPAAEGGARMGGGVEG